MTISLSVILSVCLCLSLLFTTSTCTNTNILATWLPVSYGTASAAEVDDTIKNLASHGVQRVYVDVWNNGNVYFQSPTMEDLLRDRGGGGIGRDILSWSLESGSKYKVEIVAWFEYGLMCSYDNLQGTFASYASSSGWVMGQYSNFYWMDPSNKDVQSFLTGLITDAIKGYAGKGLVGVQLDDHFASPVALGGSVAAMNSIARLVQRSIKNTSPASIFSLSPSPLDQALNSYSVDWNKWGTDSLYDEVIPQLYRSTFQDYELVFNQTMKGVSSRTNQLWTASGVRLNGSGEPTPESDLQQMMTYSEKNGKNNVIWYAEGIIDIYPDLFSANANGYTIA